MTSSIPLRGLHLVSDLLPGRLSPWVITASTMSMVSPTSWSARSWAAPSGSTGFGISTVGSLADGGLPPDATQDHAASSNAANQADPRRL